MLLDIDNTDRAVQGQITYGMNTLLQSGFCCFSWTSNVWFVNIESKSLFVRFVDKSRGV